MQEQIYTICIGSAASFWIEIVFPAVCFEREAFSINTLAEELQNGMREDL